ncbi:MAG: LPS-assembly lipoprotein LptE [Burkholderiales bacterium]
MRKLVLVFLVFMLASCGFHLRGQEKFPFESLAISPAGSPLAVLLKRSIESGSEARVVNAPTKSSWRLEILSEAGDRIILSLDATGQVREYQLRYKVAFRLLDDKGDVLIPRSELFLTRLLSYNISEILAKESEAVLLNHDMQSDAVDQIIRRLAAVKPDEN